MVFGGNVPFAAGMSSSSTIVVGTLWSLNRIYNFKFTDMDLLPKAVKVEHEYIGLLGGIMD